MYICPCRNLRWQGRLKTFVPQKTKCSVQPFIDFKLPFIQLRSQAEIFAPEVLVNLHRFVFQEIQLH